MAKTAKNQQEIMKGTQIPAVYKQEVQRIEMETIPIEFRQDIQRRQADIDELESKLKIKLAELEQLKESLGLI